MGDFFHTTYPAGAFAWLDQYEPVEHIGKTIRLYYIPRDAHSGRNQSHGEVRQENMQIVEHQ